MPSLADLWAFVSNNGGTLGLAIFLVLAFIRGWVVPGYIYAATVTRMDKMLDGIQTLSIAVDRLTDEVRSNRRAR